MTVRLVYTDAPEKAFPEGTIVAVIGPFASHEDKGVLQARLESLLERYNEDHKK